MEASVVLKSQTGMQGVYLVAAELTHLGFIVSTTSRSAFGADILATDQRCQRAWSVQVKTNHQRMSFWLLSKHAKEIKSPTHVYVFVTLNKNQRPDFHVVRSEFVAEHVYEEETKGSTWYSFDRSDIKPDSEGWEIFGDPGLLEPQADASD
jgi:hypothetical protein